ncbi:hypothetical protein RUM43_009509 [Polyplax serrata]|uniref:Pyridoxal kinase n=1 Tax=Polyplax serrata TaxID=468196 RepID=A0AAN8S8K2_POLSC
MSQRRFSTRCAETDTKSMRVLSIQSHVVSGYVGNKSATFPLQVLGFEVDAINSVQFSNHTGYGFWTGQVLQKSDLEELVKGLTQNNLDNYSHLLTGYTADATFLRKIGDVVKQLRKVNPSLIYVCDPVIGDNGRIYVSKELIPIYRNEIIPLANIITPNQFELELIADRTIRSVEDAIKAIDYVHEMGVEIIFLSSSDLASDDNLLALISRKKGNKREVLKMTFPRLPASFTGTGDLTAALFLAWHTKTQNDLQASIENTIATMQAVVKRTFQIARQSTDGDNPTVSSLELKLIQSKDDIENPTCTIAAEQVLL